MHRAVHRRLLFGRLNYHSIQYINVMVELPDEVTNGILGTGDVIPQALDDIHGVSLFDLAFAAHGQNILTNICKIICHDLAKPVVRIRAR